MGYYENYKDYSDFKELKSEFIGKFITLVKISDFGYPYTVEFKVESAELRDYAQHKNCIYLVGKAKRKRTSKAYLIRPNDVFVLFKGSYELPEKEVTTENGLSIINLGRCFDYNKFISTVQHLKENKNTIYYNLGA